MSTRRRPCEKALISQHADKALTPLQPAPGLEDLLSGIIQHANGADPCLATCLEQELGAGLRDQHTFCIPRTLAPGAPCAPGHSDLACMRKLITSAASALVVMSVDVCRSAHDLGKQKMADMGKLEALTEYHTMTTSGDASAPETLPDGVTALTCPGYTPPPPPPPDPAPRPPRGIRALDPTTLDYRIDYSRPPEFSSWGNGTVLDKAWLVDAGPLRPKSWTTCYRARLYGRELITHTHLVKRHRDEKYHRLYDYCMYCGFDMIDCDNSGNISAQEASYWGVPAVNFSSIDLNGDGHVQKRSADNEEWKRLVHAIEDLLFAAYDINGNGVLDVVAAPPSRSEYENAFVLDFSDFDDDGSCAGGSGVSLSVAEEHWNSNGMSRPHFVLESYFKTLDADGSGCIDQPAEFASAFGYGPHPPARKSLDLPSGWGDDQVYTW